MTITSALVRGATAIIVSIAALTMVRPAADAAALRLKYVAIVSRHGVRSPTWTPDRLKEYSAEAWPDFGVPPGYLTPHGAKLMEQMGAYYGEWLASERLLTRGSCADAGRVYLWADTDQRTLDTGRALSTSLLPGCSINVHSQPTRTTEDPLFDPIAAGIVTPDAKAALKAVRDRMGADSRAFLEPYRATFLALDQVLTGGATAKERPFESPAGLDVVIKDNTVELTGPLNTASTLSENLLLEYTNGFSGRELGWGRLNAGNLKQVLALHTAYADLMRRTPYLARVRGSNLLAHVLRSIEQATTGAAVAGALGRPGDAVLIISGHDTNLSNISGMLGLTWTLPGYPDDDTPPGGALVFSLWQDPANGRFLVRTKYVAQTLDQMHNGDPLSIAKPPAMQELHLPGCRVATNSTDCPWDAFARAVTDGLDPAFVR